MKWLKDTMVSVFKTRLGESLVTLGTGKWPISSMDSLVSLFMLVDTEKGMSHNEQAKG